MDVNEGEDSSGPSSLSSDQASLCVIPDPDDSTEEDDFIYLDKSSLPESLNVSEQDRTVIVFHSVDEEYRADQDIVCEYIRPDKWQESWKDAIYLFKVGWVTHRDFVCAVPVPEPNNDPIGRVLLSEHLLPKDTTNLYQFCYLRDFTVLGASTPFQFKLLDVKKCENGSNKSVSLVHGKDEAIDEVDNNRAKNLSCSCSSGFSDSASVKNANIDTVHSFIQERAEVALQGCDNAPTLEGSSFHGWGNYKGDSCSVDNGQNGGSLSSSHEFPPTCEGKELAQQQSKEDSSLYKQRFEEAIEEKKWLQEQYNSLLITVKKYAEDLASVRSEKESLDGRISDMAISQKMLCSENARLHNELEATKHLLQKQTTKSEMLLSDIKTIEEQLDAASHTNDYLTEEVVHLKTQIKLQKDAQPSQQPCQCENSRKKSYGESDYEVIKNTLEVELQQELKLSAERENYVSQLEKNKLNNLENTFTQLSGMPNTSGNIDKVREMEDNMNSTLEALECCMKEMEVLRSRKAAINRTNRVLREDFMQKQEEWKERELKQKFEHDGQIRDLLDQIEREKASRRTLLEEIDIMQEKLNRQIFSEASVRKGVSDSLEAAHKEIESLLQQKRDVERECSLLKQQIEKDVNITLLKNLEEAREEYKKLYTEKIKIQEKLTRLQQKVKTKKNTRSNQDTSEIDSAKTEFLNSVSSSWRAIVDELM